MTRVKRAAVLCQAPSCIERNLLEPLVETLMKGTRLYTVGDGCKGVASGSTPKIRASCSDPLTWAPSGGVALTATGPRVTVRSESHSISGPALPRLLTVAGAFSVCPVVLVVRRC